MQKYAMKLCVKLGKSAEGKLEMPEDEYGAGAMSRAGVFRWCKHFKNGK
jgi:hypothetical protein